MENKCCELTDLEEDVQTDGNAGWNSEDQTKQRSDWHVARARDQKEAKQGVSLKREKWYEDE